MKRYFKIWGISGTMVALVAVVGSFFLGLFAITTIKPSAERIEYGSAISVSGLYLIYVAPMYLIAASLIAQKTVANFKDLAVSRSALMRAGLGSVLPLAGAVAVSHSLITITSLALTYFSTSSPIMSFDWRFTVAQFLLIGTVLAAGVVFGLTVKSVLIPPVIGLALIAVSFLSLSFFIRNFFTPGTGTPSSVFLEVSTSKLYFRLFILLVVLGVLYLVLAKSMRQRVIVGSLIVGLTFGLGPRLAGEDVWMQERTSIAYDCTGAAPQICAPTVMLSLADEKIGTSLRGLYGILPHQWLAMLPPKITLTPQSGYGNLFYDPIQMNAPQNQWLTVQEVILGPGYCDDRDPKNPDRQMKQAMIVLAWLDNRDPSGEFGVRAPDSASRFFEKFRELPASKQDAYLMEMVKNLRGCQPWSQGVVSFLDQVNV